jgi:hypothetical protein
MTKKHKNRKEYAKQKRLACQARNRAEIQRAAKAREDYLARQAFEQIKRMYDENPVNVQMLCDNGIVSKEICDQLQIVRSAETFAASATDKSPEDIIDGIKTTINAMKQAGIPINDELKADIERIRDEHGIDVLNTDMVWIDEMKDLNF